MSAGLTTGSPGHWCLAGYSVGVIINFTQHCLSIKLKIYPFKVLLYTWLYKYEKAIFIQNPTVKKQENCPFFVAVSMV